MSKKTRNMLTDKIDVDDKTEFDYLTEIDIPFKDFDSAELIYVVHNEDLLRMDLISQKVYGTPYYWWVIAKRNDIIDPYSELYVGMNLLIPNISNIFSFFSKKRKTVKK